MTNPAGNLVLHIEGNLREYIGRQLGGIPYTRQREREFSLTALPKQEVMVLVEEWRHLIPSILDNLPPQQMKAPYPEIVLETPLSTEAFLVHLYGHLNWHLGQIDTLRRALTGDGASPTVGSSSLISAAIVHAQSLPRLPDRRRSFLPVQFAHRVSCR